MKIYTKSGDQGHTSLIGGERVLKCDPRVEAYGTADELSAHIAMLKDMLINAKIADFDKDFTAILRILMSIESLMALSSETRDKVKNISTGEIEYLEVRIDEISSLLPPITYFTIPGGNILVSQSHICRTVCRRAERRAYQAALEHELSPEALKYLNRLSDYLYVVGRRLTDMLKVEEVLWVP